MANEDIVEFEPRIVAWEGICYIPGRGKVDDRNRELVMTTHTNNERDTPDEAWTDAQALGKEHSSEYIAIRPILEKAATPSGRRRLITLAIFETEMVPE